MNNTNKFIETYKKNLEHAVRNYPNEYSYDIDSVPEVASRMEKAIHKGSFNKDSRAFKLTCQELGIAHTYKAIDEFMKVTQDEARATATL